MEPTSRDEVLTGVPAFDHVGTEHTTDTADRRTMSDQLDEAPSTTHRRDTAVMFQERPVQITIEIEPPPQCPLYEVENDVHDVLFEREGDTCRCDVTITVDLDGQRGTLVAQLTSSGLERCASHVFEEFGCVSEIVDVRDSHLIVRTFVPEDIELDALLDGLREVCSYVKLKRVTGNLNESATQAVVDVDISDVTPKQYEALSFAIREGYYARPREISLAAMAEEFGISEQALAQRLARAEQTVMGQLVT